MAKIIIIYDDNSSAVWDIDSPTANRVTGFIYGDLDLMDSELYAEGAVTVTIPGED